MYVGLLKFNGKVNNQIEIWILLTLSYIWVGAFVFLLEHPFCWKKESILAISKQAYLMIGDACTYVLSKVSRRGKGVEQNL